MVRVPDEWYQGGCRLGLHVLPLPSYVGRAGGEKVSTFDSRRLYVALPRHVGVQQERNEHVRQEDHLLNLFCCPWEQIKLDHTGGVAERWARLLNLYHTLIAAYFSGQSWLCWPARVQLKLVDIKGEPM